MNREFEIIIEIFNKKVKAKVIAKSESEAKEKALAGLVKKAKIISVDITDGQFKKEIDNAKRFMDIVFGK